MNSRPCYTLARCLLSAAALTFVHIEYDPAGADTGREFVIIHNDGPAVDLANWRFAEGGSNHKLIALGASIVPAGGDAVIASDGATYAAEHAGSTDIIFDSSFSLSNTGETLALKDASSTIVVQTSYVAEPKPAPATKVTKKTTTKKTTSKTSATPTPTFATSTQTAAPIAAAPVRQGSLWPWVAGIIALAVGAGVLLFFVPKTGPSGYEIIDTPDK
jgi:hypothetical protein